MKIGDVVILKGKVVEKECGSISSKGDHLTLIEGKADIGGCVLAKDWRGEVHCINPDLFEVVWTREEEVARKMMDPEPVQFKPVSLPEIEQRLLQSMAQMVSVNLDKEITADWKWVEGKMNASRHEPPPRPGEKRVLDLVLADLRARAEAGKIKYGTYLMTRNGRDALMDAYQEALDLVMYLRQELEEKEERRG